jgi:hypothetical protein
MREIAQQYHYDKARVFEQDSPFLDDRTYDKQVCPSAGTRLRHGAETFGELSQIEQQKAKD